MWRRMPVTRIVQERFLLCRFSGSGTGRLLPGMIPMFILLHHDPGNKDTLRMSLLRISIAKPIRGNRIKRAAGSRCELCGKEEAVDNLVVHTIIGDEEVYEYSPGCMEPFLLVLCFRCHEAVHVFAAPEDEQEALALQRPAAVRRVIRHILAAVPRPYTPPGTDIEEAYRDACSSRFRFGV